MRGGVPADDETGALPMAMAMSAVVVCGGADHVVRAAGGHLELLGHPGAREDDDVLVALSGAPARCRAIEEAWTKLDRAHAEALLDASPEHLARMAHRLPVTLEQREKTRRRDDLTDAQRARLLASFDQEAYAAEVASLGPALARQRAVTLLAPPWRRALRRVLVRG